VATTRVHIIPNAKIDTLVGEHGDAIKIKLRVPTMAGKANAALHSFGGKIEVLKSAIVLERGERSRDKVIRIDGLSEEDIRRSLLGPSRNSSTAIR
jgi:hypothetical protein